MGFGGRDFVHLIIIRARVCTHIHNTSLTNPSPYSLFDGMGGFWIIRLHIRTSSIISATLQRIYTALCSNGLRWQIICNGQQSSATRAWQMWQMGFRASATGTRWFSSVRTSVADVYVILYDNSPFCHPEEPCDEGPRVHKAMNNKVDVHEILRFALDDTIKD